MNRPPAAQPDVLLASMDALADEKRLRLLRLLEANELSVAELCGILQSPQSTISRHLKVLADDGWLRSRRSGTTHRYRMRPEELDPTPRRLWLLAREQTEQWATSRQDELRLARVLRDRGDDGAAFFAGAAGEWDRLRQELYGSNFAQSAALAMLPRTTVLADLGCGTGQLTAEAAAHVRRVIAVDNSAAMLKAARGRTADLSNVQVRHGDLRAIPIEDGVCDAAAALLVLTYVQDAPKAVAEMARILSPGGRAVVVDLLAHDREDFARDLGQQRLGFSPEEMTAMLRNAGLTGATLRPLAPEPRAKGPALFLAWGTKPSGSVH